MKNCCICGTAAEDSLVLDVQGRDLPVCRYCRRDLDGLRGPGHDEAAAALRQMMEQNVSMPSVFAVVEDAISRSAE